MAAEVEPRSGCAQAVDQRVQRCQVLSSLVTAMRKPPVFEAGCGIDLNDQSGSVPADRVACPGEQHLESCRPHRGETDAVGRDAEWNHAEHGPHAFVGASVRQGPPPLGAG